MHLDLLHSASQRARAVTPYASQPQRIIQIVACHDHKLLWSINFSESTHIFDALIFTYVPGYCTWLQVQEEKVHISLGLVSWE